MDNEKEQLGFEDLKVYQEARNFRKRIYKLAKLLPPEEKYALAPQMQRAAISLTNNIAEGYGRYNRGETIRFCGISRGSLMELFDDINICLDEEYAKPPHLQDLRATGKIVLRLLNGFIKYLRQKKAKGES